MRRRRLWICVLGILVSLVFAAWPGRSTFTVATDTTYVTEPLDKHGYVDYVSALNERLGKGITPENNANVLIWQALGPRPEGTTMTAEYFQWLGIEPLPEAGKHLVSWQDFLKQGEKKDDGIKRMEYAGQQLEISKKPWTAQEQPELAEWLNENDGSLALFIRATRSPEYYNPVVPKRTEDWSPGLISSLLPTVQKCREVANALICRAMLRVGEGRIDDAWDDLLACHRLGRQVARGACLIELLVGMAIDQTASTGDVAFLEHAKLSSDQVLAYLEDLRRLPPMPNVADKMDLGERFTLLESIMLTARQGTAFLDGVAGSGSKPSTTSQFTARLFTRSVDWDPAFRNANRWIDRLVAIMRMTDRDRQVQEMAAFADDLKALKDRTSDKGFMRKSVMGSAGRGEIIGNILICLLLPAYDRVYSAAERCEQVQQNLIVAFGLAAYQRDHGRYPAKLDELAPKYLKAVPDDLFSGKPLIYRLQDDGYLLYSVGVNGIDEDARGHDDLPRGDDVTIRIPTLEPPGKN